jgi:NADH-quinone oxidoreductase subunit L
LSGYSASGLYYLVWAIGIITTFLTAFYMFRLVYGTFNGPFKLPSKIKEAVGAKKYLQESSLSMTTPMWILGVLSAVGGLLGLPVFWVEAFGNGGAHINLMNNWLQHVTAGINTVLQPGLEGGLMAVSVALAVGGLVVAWFMYGSGDTETADASLRTYLGPLYRLWNRKYSVDEIYEGLIGRPVLRFSDKVLAVIDSKVVDGVVRFVSGTVRLSGSLIRYIQTGVASAYVLIYVLGVILVLCLLIFV